MNSSIFSGREQTHSKLRGDRTNERVSPGNQQATGFHAEMLALRPALRNIARISASKRTPLRPSRRLLTAESEGASKGGTTEAASEAKPKESSCKHCLRQLYAWIPSELRADPLTFGIWHRTAGRLALFAATLATFGVGYAAYEITENPEGELAQKYHGSAVEGAVNQALGGLWEWFAGMHKPQLDKVMDDWPYPGYPAVRGSA